MRDQAALEIAASADALPAGAAPSPTMLEPALWKQAVAARTLEDLAPAWLALQCRMIPTAEGGVVWRLREGALPETVARVPAAFSPSPEFAKVAATAVKEERGVALALPGGPPCVAHPLVVDGTVVAVAVLRLRTRERDEVGAAVRQLQWGLPWLAERLLRQRAQTRGQVLEQSRAALDCLATTLDQESFTAAAMAAVTDLAIRFGCLRVSLGFCRGDTVRVAAISHSAQFGQQMQLVRLVGDCMQEAIDQRATLSFPLDADAALASHAHAALAKLQHDGRVLTVPLLVVDRFAGAVTLERAGDQPFTRESVALVESICAALAPVLDAKRLNDRWLPRTILDSLRANLKRLTGPDHVATKLATGLALALVLFFLLAQGPYRVTADARIEGSVRRSLVAATDGFLKEAHARAGDTVQAGTVLAALEDRDLALERLRWVTERQQRAYEYDRALAARQPAQINVIKSQIDQAEAQTRLIDEQLLRAKLRAPFDGLVVSGDLSQSIGAAVSRGQVLFEIAPLDGYRVILFVDERQVADIRTGQTGRLLATSLPDETFPLTVEKITPVAEVRGGRNLFRVEGRLGGVSERLRPGMEGVAKVDVDDRLLIRIWTRPILDWLRVWTWQWLP